MTIKHLSIYCTLLLAANLAWAQNPNKISTELSKVAANASVDVIVQFSGELSAAQHLLVTGAGGILKQELPSGNAAVYSVPQSALTKLNSQSKINFVSSNRLIRPTLDYASSAVSAAYSQQLQLHGENIGVAVIDSGISPTDDLKYGFPGSDSGVVYSESFVPGKPLALDEYGHGTHVAGILAGSGAASTGSQFTHTLVGIAPKVKLINLRVLDQNGAGTDASVISAIDRAIQLRKVFNIKVINLSVGRPVYESYTKDPLCRAVERAWAKGIVVVVAAGNYGRSNNANNNGYGTITAPGNDPVVITVGAYRTESTTTTSDDYITSYSSKGPSLLDHVVKPDLVAPGNKMVSSKSPKSTLANAAAYPTAEVPNSYYIRNGNNNNSPDYLRLSGTSMATPMVAGAVALIAQQNPQMTPDQIKARLMKTADKNYPKFSVTTGPQYGPNVCEPVRHFHGRRRLHEH